MQLIKYHSSWLPFQYREVSSLIPTPVQAVLALGKFHKFQRPIQCHGIGIFISIATHNTKSYVDFVHCFVLYWNLCYLETGIHKRPFNNWHFLPKNLNRCKYYIKANRLQYNCYTDWATESPHYYIFKNHLRISSHSTQIFIISYLDDSHISKGTNSVEYTLQMYSTKKHNETWHAHLRSAILMTL